MNKRKAKKLTLNQLKEQNKYMHARARVAEKTAQMAMESLKEIIATTEATLRCVVELTGCTELSLPMSDLKSALNDTSKRVVVEITEDSYKVKVVDICTTGAASTEA
jgi:hypothetical protein